MNKIQVVAIVLEQDYGVLVFEKRSEKGMPGGSGVWEFPGGKVEPGEPLKDALKREIREELGCEVVLGDLINSSYHQLTRSLRMQMNAYFGRFVEKAPVLMLTDHEQYRVVKPTDLLKINLSPADISIAYQVIAFSKQLEL